jgi:hypothetical protein
MEPRRITVNKDGLIVDLDSGEVIRPIIDGFDTSSCCSKAASH